MIRMRIQRDETSRDHVLLASRALSRLDRVQMDTLDGLSSDVFIERIDSRLCPDGSAQRGLADTTIAMKGHDHPLIDTGQLRGSSSLDYADDDELEFLAPDGYGAIIDELEAMGFGVRGLGIDEANQVIEHWIDAMVVWFARQALGGSR